MEIFIYNIFLPNVLLFYPEINLHHFIHVCNSISTHHVSACQKEGHSWSKYANKTPGRPNQRRWQLALSDSLQAVWYAHVDIKSVKIFFVFYSLAIFSTFSLPTSITFARYFFWKSSLLFPVSDITENPTAHFNFHCQSVVSRQLTPFVSKITVSEKLTLFILIYTKSKMNFIPVNEMTGKPGQSF